MRIVTRRPALRMNLAIMLSLFAAGCSSAAPHHHSSSPGPMGTPATKATVSTVSTSVVSGKPRTTVPLARRLVARVHIDNPDALVAALGYIWVKTDDGRVVKVDAVTNRIVVQRKIDTAKDPSHYCQGIGTDGRSVWACSAGDRTTDVVRLDPRSLQPVRRVAAHKEFGQEHFPYVAGRLWVLGGGDGSRLLAIDPSTGASTGHRLPAKCLQAAGSGTVLVLTCRNDNAVLRIDPQHGTVLARRSLPQPEYITVSGTETWVDTTDGVQRLDAALRTTVRYKGLVLGLSGDLGTDAAGNIWARQQQGFLFRIDPQHNHVSEQITVSTPTSGGSILLTPRAIWTTASDDATLLRLRP